MKIAGVNPILYNNSLRSNTDTKVKYNNTSDIPQGSFVKSTATQPTNAQDVSFGESPSEVITSLLSKTKRYTFNSGIIKGKTPNSLEEDFFVEYFQCNSEEKFLSRIIYPWVAGLTSRDSKGCYWLELPRWTFPLNIDPFKLSEDVRDVYITKYLDKHVDLNDWVNASRYD